MSLDHDIAALSGAPLFAGFEREQLRLLAFGAERRRLSAGSRLYRQGGFCEGGYVVLDGTFSLHDGDEHAPVKEYAHPGRLLAPMGLIAAIDHDVSCVAPQEGGEVLKIPRPLFRRMLEEYPDLAERLHGRIAGEVRDFMGELEDVRARLDAADGV